MSGTTPDFTVYNVHSYKKASSAYVEHIYADSMSEASEYVNDAYNRAGSAGIDYLRVVPYGEPTPERFLALLSSGSVLKDALPEYGAPTGVVPETESVVEDAPVLVLKNYVYDYTYGSNNYSSSLVIHKCILTIESGVLVFRDAEGSLLNAVGQNHWTTVKEID